MGFGVRTLYFLFCLASVPAISKKDRFLRPDKKGSRAARKAAKVADVREMRHHQPIQIVLLDRQSKAAQAKSVLHRGSVARSRSLFLRHQFSTDTFAPR